MSIFERYTQKSRGTMHLAKCEADGFGSLEVSAEHILLALLGDPALISGTMEGVSESEIRDAINAHIPHRRPDPLPHDLPLNKEAWAALVLATEEADRLGHRHVQNEHVLLGLVQSESSYAARLLRQKGITAEKLRLQIKTLPQAKEVHERSWKSKKSVETELIRRVSKLVGRGKGKKALRLLDDYMAEPGQDRELRMRFLGHFAVVMATKIGDLKTARRYCEELLAYSPGEPMSLYALADCLARQGETDEARRRAADCRKAALSRGDELGKGMVELVERRFPELKAQP
jgi:tetratricopeptide (TPR) repeat protein